MAAHQLHVARFVTVSTPPRTRPTRVIVADDSGLFRDGVTRILTESDIDVPGQARDGDELVRMVRDDPPDAVVVDIRMPPTGTDEGLIAARSIRREHPDVGVLVLSTFIDTAFAFELATELPERMGYLLKDRVADGNELVDAIRRIDAGGIVIDPVVVARLVAKPRERSPIDELSEREREVLALMAEGRSNQAIGQRLFLSERTVEAYVRSIFTKLNLEPTADDHRRILAVLAFLRA
jgi:DNA-binding NarL/FixJ family response regulator